MRIRRRTFVLAVVAALGVGLIAFPTSAAAAPPLVPACTPKATGAEGAGSRSCVTLKSTGLVGSPYPGPIGAGIENIKLGVRARATFITPPPPSEWNSVILRFDDNIALNLAAVTGGHTPCPASELMHRTIAQAWEQCGPGADVSPTTEGNAYLSTGLGANVSGIATLSNGVATVSGCTMVFKGANNNQVTLYIRAPITNPTTTGCNNPATNTGGNTTYILPGNITTIPVSNPSPYSKVITFPATHVTAVNPPLNDFYATLTRGAVFRATCPGGQSPHKIQGEFAYTAGGGGTDIISPPYAGTQDSCANN